uniref:Uncharacterized protein n=1 Tax=Promethearchaeum syntrophicum TaxID=2594042 RepID=A0A5B9D8K6_9ARCH|nr:hypothetical protein DSAG12_01160 [Candidatus Prometheoarchaeum syntrophicum]
MLRRMFVLNVVLSFKIINQGFKIFFFILLIFIGTQENKKNSVVTYSNPNSFRSLLGFTW